MAAKGVGPKETQASICTPAGAWLRVTEAGVPPTSEPAPVRKGTPSKPSEPPPRFVQAWASKTSSSSAEPPETKPPPKKARSPRVAAPMAWRARSMRADGPQVPVVASRVSTESVTPPGPEPPAKITVSPTATTDEPCRAVARVVTLQVSVAAS